LWATGENLQIFHMTDNALCGGTCRSLDLEESRRFSRRWLSKTLRRHQEAFLGLILDKHRLITFMFRPFLNIMELKSARVPIHSRFVVVSGRSKVYPITVFVDRIYTQVSVYFFNAHGKIAFMICVRWVRGIENSRGKHYW
jgi:hypothetical protein